MIEIYFLHLGILLGIYLILSLSLQITFGYTGLINFGHMAFFGVGAYVSALLMISGLPFIIAISLAGVLSALTGFLLATLTNKLRGDYLALATLGFSFVVYNIFINWRPLTGGALGLSGIPAPSLLGLDFSSSYSFFVLIAIITLLVYFLIKKLVDSPLGKVMEAIRDNEMATNVLGKNTFKIKIISFSVSAFFAGIAGSMYAHYITFIDPSSFTVMQLIPIITIVIIGGLASLKGTIIATIVLVLLPEPLRLIGFSNSLIGPIRHGIYAIILLLILIYKPKGFFGKVELE